MLPIELSLEQQARYRNYEVNLSYLSREQVEEMFLSVMCQLMIKDNVIVHLMKQNFL